MVKNSADIEKQAADFADQFGYDELIHQLAVVKYEISRIKTENSEISELYIFNPYSEKSVEYHLAMAKLIEIEHRLDYLGKEESKKGYSDKYGLRVLYESGQKMQISNEDLDANNKKMRSGIDSGGRVMAGRRSKKTGVDVKFKAKKTRSATTYWFERSEKKAAFK